MESPAILTDDRLVSLSRDGHLDAFNSIVERHQSAVYTLCFRLLGDPGAAEDAAQETFLAAYRALARFDGGNVRGWLLRIAANESKDELRRRKRRAPTDPLFDIFDGVESEREIPGDDPLPEAEIERMELNERLQGALLQVPFDQRNAVLLCDYYGFRYEEVASMTSSSIGTVKSRIHRGRERLRSILSLDPELFGAARRQEGQGGRR